MKKVVLLLLLLPMEIQASSLNNIYWSTFMCNGFIYHFDENNNVYKKYTREFMKIGDEPRYTSYRLIEGEFTHIEGSVYSLTGDSIKGVTTIDFSNMKQPHIKSSKYGLIVLKQCDVEQSKKLISEAEIHFKKCPKNDIYCKSP